MPIAALLGLLGVVLAALGVASPQQPVGPVETADSLVSAWVDAERIPGAVLRISLDGEPIFERAYGWAFLYDYGEGQYQFRAGAAGGAGIERRTAPVRMTTETAFDLASVTKVMATTYATMLLVDRGAVEIDEPVQTYLSDFRGDGKEEVTLRHLLTHRSGLSQWQPIYYHAPDPAQAYSFLRDLPLEWSVGAERHYSDLGFMLLGLVVERVTGQPLNAFLERELYGPLGLGATGFRPTAPLARGADGPFAATSHGNPFERRMVHDSTFGYRIDVDPDVWDGWREYTLSGEVNDGNAFHAFGGVAGHAGLFSNARDLSILLQLLIEGGEWGGRRYLSREVIDSFLSSAGDEQALGWQLPADAPPSAFGHTGFTGTYALGVPDAGLSIVLLTNRQNVGVNSETSYVDVGPLQRAVVEAIAGTGREPGKP